MARLSSTVHVDGKVYGPGEVSDDIAARIDNPKAWDGDPPSNAGSAVVDQRFVGRAPAITPPVPTPVRPAPVESGIPPKGGAGSGRDAWAVYAAGKVDVDEDATRDEIVAALNAAGVPTE